MAKYSRDFLVPYLENICALHIAKRKVEEKSRKVVDHSAGITREIRSLQEPDEPVYESTGFQKFGLIMGIVSVIISLFGIPIISFLAGLAGWFMVIVYGVWLYKVSSANQEEEQRYFLEEKTYNRRLEELQKKDSEYSTEAFVVVSICQSELKKIDDVLKKAYDVNVIPRRYRDIYAAVYLYDWFSTSMSDDLDVALNMFVLEEIKDRLDEIISQLAEILINQRTIMDNQEKSMEQQEQYRRELMDKLDRMQVTAEEHSCYLGMIEANTAATAYFSAANYVRKL